MAVAPDGESESARGGEFEAAAAGKFVGRGGDGGAEGLDLGEGFFQVFGEEEGANVGRERRVGIGADTALEPAVVEGGVVGAVIGEGPREGGGEEGFGGGEVASGEFEVVDATVGGGNGRNGMVGKKSGRFLNLEIRNGGRG